MELLVVSSVCIRNVVVMMILYRYCGSSVESTELLGVLVSGCADYKIIILSRMVHKFDIRYTAALCLSD